MAVKQTEAEDTGTAVLERMTDILEQMQRNAPPDEPGFGHPEYQKRLRDEGHFDEFAVEVYQNGKKAEPRGLKKETLERVGKLKDGTYMKGTQGQVEVSHDGRGRVHLSYRAGTVMDSIKFSMAVGDFDAMIAKIWAEQNAA